MILNIISIMQFSNCRYYMKYENNNKLYEMYINKSNLKKLEMNIISLLTKHYKKYNKFNIISFGIILKDKTQILYPNFDFRIDNLFYNLYYDIIKNDKLKALDHYEILYNIDKKNIILKYNIEIKSYIYDYIMQLKKKYNRNTKSNLISDINENISNNTNIDANKDNNNSININNNHSINNTKITKDNQNNSIIKDKGENIHYINSRFIQSIINKQNIEKSKISIIEVKGDGNCLMRCISLFYYKNENLHNIVRKEIIDYLKEHKDEYEDIILETEDGNKNINDYIKYISQDGIWGGELEKYAAQELYKINIADYKEILYENNKNNPQIQFIFNLNQDKNYNKDLCLLLFVNNCHYNLIFDKEYKPFKNKNNKLIFLKLINDNKKICLKKINKNNISLDLQIKEKKNEIIENNIKEDLIKKKETKKSKIDNTKILNNNVNNTTYDDIIKSKKDNIELNKTDDNTNLIDLSKYLIDFQKLSYDEIINLYKDDIGKINKYSDIYAYLLSKKKKKDNKIVWPDKFKQLETGKKLKNKKKAFRKACKDFIIINKRLYQYRTLHNLFDGSIKIIKCLILTNKEAYDFINKFHIELLHLGKHMLQYEIVNRGFYIYNITNLIDNVIKECKYCIMNKISNFIKPQNQQIISKKPLERVQADITYFNKNIELKDLKYKYLLNFLDHFSKLAKSYIINNKKTETVIEKFEDFINKIGKPDIIQTDNGGEFVSNKFKNFCNDNNIKLVNGAPYHPQSQGAIEAYNKNIVQKLTLFKIEKKNKFNLIEDLEHANLIYNNTTHSSTKISPIKAFKLTKKKDINKVIENVIKSQINLNKNSDIVRKGSKALLCNNITLKGKIIMQKKKVIKIILAIQK